MFGERLKLARKKAGFSLRGLSEALDKQVSAQALGKYERGEMMPGSDILTALSKCLDASLEYLLSTQVEHLDGVEFRKHSGTSAKERARVEASVIEHVERYLSVEDILELDSAKWNTPFHPRKLKSEDAAEELAGNLREKWGLGLNPIPNMTELLEENGIKVFIIDLPQGVSGLTCLVSRGTRKTYVPVIVVNRKVTLERRRFTLAHELAHRLIHEGSTVNHEKAANYFAGAFLVPLEHLNREIGVRRRSIGYQELVQLKRMYRVGAAAMLMRLKHIGVLNESSVAYAFQTFARKWRKEEPNPIESEGMEGKCELPKRFHRLCYRALSEQLISPGKATELLQEPLCVIEQKLKGPEEADAHYRQ